MKEQAKITYPDGSYYLTRHVLPVIPQAPFRALSPLKTSAFTLQKADRGQIPDDALCVNGTLFMFVSRAGNFYMRENEVGWLGQFSEAIKAR